LGNLLAVHVLETAGCQEYTLDRRRMLERFAAAYGKDQAAEVTAHLLG
jgi:adenosine kinase